VDLALVKLSEAPKGDSADKKLICNESDFEDATRGYLNFGTLFDCFDTLSNTEDPRVSADALSNRFFLRDVMAEHGFTNYDKEWWHYTLADEPFTDQYFDFPVR
jgi:D-alanyl-D-alanine dipeptidase